MTNNIGYSSIYPASGAGSAGPVGPTGPTGPAQTIRGATGATGLDSNYITQVVVAEDGTVQLVLSDGTSTSAGILQGATGIYAGLTASSVGGGYAILKGVCGGITLDFYNFRTSGLLGLTYDADGTLIFTISANTTAGGISASTENNRIVYVKEKTYIMSTDLIPESTTVATRIGNSHYGYVNFGGETAGRNVVADITDSILSVGPFQRGEKIITLDDFYDVDTDGITLDVSRATVYQLTTPIGIKGFRYDTIPTGQIMSVTLVVEGDDVWNFPTDVVFDAESKPIFYPGTNILHMWRTNSDSVWRANFTARGFGVDEVKNPGVRGSCCYIDLDGTKYCEDYVTQSYCDERQGTFEGLVPCNKNSCIVNSDEKQYDGVCCSEGRCISDIDPSLCQTIGGYFISGITCGQVGEYPDSDVDNISGTQRSGLCYNQCKTPTICCKDGECLGNLTEEHCNYLGGKIVLASNCSQASCCDHIIAPGACCKQDGETYTCTNVETPFECNESGGIYMGRNTTCSSINCNCKPTTCYQCSRGNNGCNCSPVVIESGQTCSELGYYSDSSCNNECNPVSCHTCDGSDCTPVDTCVSCTGYLNGSCTESPCTTKTCYKACDSSTNCGCQSIDGIDANLPCSVAAPDYPFESCDCSNSTEGSHVACFWCFPDTRIDGSTDTSGNNPYLPNGIGSDWYNHSRHGGQAPYRAVFVVSEEDNTKLNDAIGTTDSVSFTIPHPKFTTVEVKKDSYENGGVSGKRGLYYIEDWTNRLSPTNFIPSGLESNPISVSGKFYCSFVGSYVRTIDPAQNKINCLERFGYTSESEKQNCKLCDPLTTIRYKTRYDLGNTITLDKLEPYHNEVKCLAAPFPPIWGRITYSKDYTDCAKGKYLKETTNLNLLNRSDTVNMINSFYDGNGKTFWNNLTANYINNPNNQTAQIIFRNKMRTAMNSQIGDSTLACTPGLFVFETQTNPVEYCTEIGAIYTQYDPYLRGFNTSGIYAAAYGLNDLTDEAACLNYGYYLPSSTVNQQIGVPPPSGVIQNELGIAEFYPLSLDSVGEIYFRLRAADEPDAIVERGIFGRNLRYNLDAFRTATVFFNSPNAPVNPGQQTMGFSNTIAIPISYQTGWDSGGSQPLCGFGCEAADCCETGGPNCSRGPDGTCIGVCLNQNTGSGGSEDSTAWILEGGWIAPSTMTTPTSPGLPGFTLLQRDQSNNTMTKSVKITEGICVEMLCPECYNYESC
jgi:hypothetical protein